MANEHQDVASRRIWDKAARIRLQVIESQLALGFTFCQIAETQREYGRLPEADLVIQKVQHLVQTVRGHLDEPNHVPEAEVGDARTHLAQLESRILEVEWRSSSAGRPSATRTQ